MKSKHLIKLILALLFLQAVLSGCASIATTKSAAIASEAKILIMPPRDVLQAGRPHPVGEGSGKQLQRSVSRELSHLSAYDLILFEPNDTLNNSNSINRSDALRAGKDAGADYVLVLDLGEFRNAAPMTFRSDFVTLQSGTLYRVSDGSEVWGLDNPLVLEKSNIGNHYGLIDDMAKSIAKSIVQ